MEKENFNRNFIMSTLRLHSPLTISQLASMVKLSRPTIYLHLENLEKKGFIKRTKNTEKKGAPVSIQIIENSVKKKDKEDLIKYLKIVNENKNLTLTELKRMNLDMDILFQGFTSAKFLGLTEENILLTNKGKEFLKENDTK